VHGGGPLPVARLQSAVAQAQAAVAPALRLPGGGSAQAGWAHGVCAPSY